MTTSPRAVRVLTAAIALVACLAGVRSAWGQAGHPSGPPGAEGYRLTLKALRAVMPALQGPAQSQCERREDKRDPFAMTLAEMTAMLERCAPVRGELRKADVSSAEAAKVLGAFLYAGRRITEEESALALGQSAPPLPPGALKDNVALLRQNEAELRRLTRPPGRDNGT
jgi:hypothetical protein